MSLSIILVADYEENMRWILSKALKGKKFTIDIASDGLQALSMIQERSYDLVVLDINMPGFGDLDLLERIRKIRNDLLVVIMTAEASIKNAVEAIKRAVILSNGPMLMAADFENIQSDSGDASQNSQETSLESIVDKKLRSCFAEIDKLDKGDILARVLQQVERPLIRFILEKTKWNQLKAADILGINRNTLRKKIHELEIELKRG